MKGFDELPKDNLHHAYGIEGDSVTALKAVQDFFENKLGLSVLGNPDFHHQKFEVFSIEDARKLVEFQSGASWGGFKKVFVIEADSMTVDAQNSLLKVLEEPTLGSHFFIIGDCVKNLIKTLDSRLARIAVKANGEDGSEIRKEAETFINAGLSSRMEIVKKLSDEIKAGKKPKNNALMFLKAVEEIIYAKSDLSGDAGVVSALSGLEMCRDYLRDRSAGVKMLLEYVAVIVPFGERS